MLFLNQLRKEYYAFTVTPTLYHSQLAIVSNTDNNTEVSIKLESCDSSTNVMYDGREYQPGSVIATYLNAYECLQTQSKYSLTRTFVTSTYPISLFSGNIKSGIKSGSSSDHLVIHVPPISS